MYILAKDNKYMADDTVFPAHISLTTNIKDAYVFKEYREAEWIASMSGLEVKHHGKEKKTQSSITKEI